MRGCSLQLTHIGCCLLSIFCASHCAGKPPQVLKTLPANGDVDVDPNLREIRITFDQAMSQGGHSIVGGGESFPELLGKTPGKWRGARTYVLRVRLQPNHSYWLSVNSDKFQNFTNRQGEPAVPYPIQFVTGAAASTKETPLAAKTPTQNQADNAAAIDQLKDCARERVFLPGSTADRLVRAAGIATRTAGSRCGLPGLRSPGRQAAGQSSRQASVAQGRRRHAAHIRATGYTERKLRRVAEARAALAATFVGGRERSLGRWHRLPANRHLGPRKTKELTPIFDVLDRLSDAPVLIIDVRANGGGDERIARSVAGCFVEKPAVYAQHVIVDPTRPTGFSEPHERTLEPNKRRTTYHGKVAVLTGPANMSSCEAFLMMMKQAPQSVLVGAASQGSSGNPQPLELDNGVTVFLPSWKSMTPDGREIEGVGIQPDIAVNASQRDFAEADPVIDAALTHLRQ